MPQLCSETRKNTCNSDKMRCLTFSSSVKESFGRLFIPFKQLNNQSVVCSRCRKNLVIRDQKFHSNWGVQSLSATNSKEGNTLQLLLRVDLYLQILFFVMPSSRKVIWGSAEVIEECNYWPFHNIILTNLLLHPQSYEPFSSFIHSHSSPVKSYLYFSFVSLYRPKRLLVTWLFQITSHWSHLSATYIIDFLRVTRV